MVTYPLIPIIGPFLVFDHSTMDVGNEPANVRNCYMRMQRQFGLEMDVQQCGWRVDNRTHLKNMKDSIEVRPPGSNRGFILLRVENTRDRISFFWLDGTPLNLRHGPAIGGVVSRSGTVNISAELNSRCQLVNRLEHEPA